MADESASPPNGAPEELTEAERRWLEAVRSAGSLAALAEVVGTESEHDAYLDAKERWKELRRAEIDDVDAADGIPGTRIDLGERPVVVHGITHADTDAERAFLREHVTDYLESGESVYCEQGVRPMYFSDMEDVCEVDDYRWAMARRQEREVGSRGPGVVDREFGADDGIGADVRSVASEFRERTFSLIDAGKNMYGDRFASALGDLASGFMTAPGELATGEDFASFQLSRAAARDPGRLAELQAYYETVFLPQPLEREWLRRHDPELELFTHARNERIAAYVLYNAPAGTPVHVLAGAAHQSGIAYYLAGYRDDEWSFEPFEAVP